MTSQPITIERACGDDLAEILAILSSADLPHEGVEEFLKGFLVARTGGGRVVGCVGLEQHGGLGLLRSAAVLPEYQKQHIGGALIRQLLNRSARDGIREVVLLTTTARKYFEAKFGFQVRERADYQNRLTGSFEWDLPRCSSAVLMALKLDQHAARRVLILCTGNSARSQMAEGILRHDGGNQFEVHSAGVRPSSVRPEAIQVMAEIGIDISGHWSKSVDEFAGQKFDYVITVCDNAKGTCPVFPGKAQHIHQSFEDPPAPGDADEGTALAIFRRVRDEIREWMKEFIEQTD